MSKVTEFRQSAAAAAWFHNIIASRLPSLSNKNFQPTKSLRRLKKLQCFTFDSVWRTPLSQQSNISAYLGISASCHKVNITWLLLCSDWGHDAFGTFTSPQGCTLPFCTHPFFLSVCPKIFCSFFTLKRKKIIKYLVFFNTYPHRLWMTLLPFSKANWFIHTQKRYCRRCPRVKVSLCALFCEAGTGGELPSAEFTLPSLLPSSIWSVISLHLPLRLPSSFSLSLFLGGRV